MTHAHTALVPLVLGLAVALLLGCRRTEPPSSESVIAADETPAAAPEDALLPVADTPEVSVPDLPAELRDHERVAAALSAESRAVLEGADHVTLHSIRAADYRDYGYGRTSSTSLLADVLGDLAAGRGVNGGTELPDAAARREAVVGVYRGLVDEGPMAHCYDPHHALVFRRGDAHVVALICFSCHYVCLIDAATEKGRIRSFQDDGDTFAASLNARLRDLGIRVGD